MGLHDYILKLRLETAYNDVILTSRALEEISESVGYSSFSHFNKICKKKYGVTPAVLRKEHGKPTI
jgi:transcriptional regulator GlxA family with amidase domain